MTGTRRRRTRDEARAEILAAAAARLLDAGPDALRIQDVAADVGMSHPTLLHHFGSREGLLQATATHLMDRSSRRTLEAMRSLSDDPDLDEVLDRSLEAFGDPARTRALAWLALTGRLEDTERPPWGPHLAAANAIRARLPGGDSLDARDETRSVLLLCFFAIFGMELLGDTVFPDVGLDDVGAARVDLRRFLASLLKARLE